MSTHCTENCEVIDLCSKNQTTTSELHDGEERAKQKSQDKMKSKTIARLESKNRPEKDNQTAETEENETAMMCWENLEDSPGKETYDETDDKEKKPVKKTQNPKDEEEHVNSTLHMGNQLKLSIKEFSWETEDDGSTLDTQETAQQQSVYITNPEDDLQKNSTKLNEEEGPKEKRPAVKNRLFERPSLVNLSHVSELYKESGSENKNIEENRKGENEKNAKESSYTNTNRHKKGKQAKLQKNEKPKKHHEILRKWRNNEKALVTKEMALSNLGKNILKGDSAGTSHMTSNKMGVYNLILINGSVMIGMDKVSVAPTKENWM